MTTAIETTAAIPIWAAFVPRRLCESANGSRNLPSCRSGPMATDRGAVIRFEIPKKQKEERRLGHEPEFSAGDLEKCTLPASLNLESGLRCSMTLPPEWAQRRTRNTETTRQS